MRLTPLFKGNSIVSNKCAEGRVKVKKDKTMYRKLLPITVFTLALLLTPVLNAQSEENGMLTFDDLERTYDLYVPASYDPETPLPLLIALHPADATGADMAQLTGFNDIAEREGFIVMYPEGLAGYWDYGYNLREWQDVEDVRNDPGFIDAAIDQVSEDYSIDAEQVYAVGYSNGARMAFRLGCELPGRIAAIAAVAVTISDDISGACPPESRVSVFYMHGTADTTTPWDGKPLYLDGAFIANGLSAYETLLFWAEQNQCVGQPMLAQKQDDDPDDGKSIQFAFYPECDSDARVIFYALTGGGHEWPTNDEINASEVIWAFFATRLPAA